MSNAAKCFSAILCNCCKYHPNSRPPPEALFGTQSKTIQLMLGITETNSLLHGDLFFRAIWEEKCDKKINLSFLFWLGKCHYSNFFHLGTVFFFYIYSSTTLKISQYLYVISHLRSYGKRRGVLSVVSQWSYYISAEHKIQMHSYLPVV